MKKYRIVYKPGEGLNPQYLFQRKFWIGWVIVDRFYTMTKALEYLEYKKGNTQITY